VRGRSVKPKAADKTTGKSLPTKSVRKRPAKKAKWGLKSSVKETPSQYEQRPPEGRQTRFIDLFCGIGGFRIAFEKAGCQCVFSSDYDRFSQQTYEANFGEKPHGDIHSVAVADIPTHDILCAGFPCQPFSIAGVSKKLSLGRKHGFDDVKQGNLFFSIADILDFHRPAAFVLENVKNLKGHEGGSTFDIIYRTLTEHLGYTVYHKIIDAKSVVPQHRERIFIVGFREWRYFEFPQFPSDGPKLGDILEPSPDPKFTLSEHLWTYLQKYAAKHRAAGNGFGFGLVTERDISRTLSARYYKDGSEILVAQKAGRIPRRLTPRECARLMGYPESFKIVVSDTQAYRQFGNSVVVPVVKRIASAVLRTLQQPLNVPADFALTAAEKPKAVPIKVVQESAHYPKPKKRLRKTSS
jgi:DNA (cytosine-5)-methyltransferase 1